MFWRCVLVSSIFTAVVAAPLIAQHPRDSAIHDADTKSWWHTTEALSNDSMEGRDTGSAAYQRAADYVAARFKAAGLQPAGDNGSYFQTVPMHQIDLDINKSRILIVTGDFAPTSRPLALLQDITVSFSDTPPVETLGYLVFRGYCGKESMKDVAQKVVMCFGTQRAGLPSGVERAANVRAAGGVGIVNIDDPYFTIEPPRWPIPYARSVNLVTGEPKRPAATPLLTTRMSDEAFTKLLTGTKHDAMAILKAQPGDPPSAVLAERCEMFLHAPPPPDWDGTFIAMTK